MVAPGAEDVSRRRKTTPGAPPRSPSGRSQVKVEDKDLTALPTPKRGTIKPAERRANAIRAIQEKWPNWEPPEKGNYARKTFSSGAGACGL